MSAIRNTNEPRGAESPFLQVHSRRHPTDLRARSVVWREAKHWPTPELGLTEHRITAAHSPFSAGAHTGWEAALLEIEHYAEHWETPEHGETGHLIAQALRTAVDIARTGGLRCEHRGSSSATMAPSAGAG